MRPIATPSATGDPDYRSELLAAHLRDNAATTSVHRRAAAGVLLRFSRDYNHTDDTATVTVPRHDIAAHLAKELSELADTTSELVSCTGARVTLRTPLAPTTARLLGITDTHDRPLRGLPPWIVAGNHTGLAAVWRAALLTAGYLDDTTGTLELACPNIETALAMTGAARRLGAGALHTREPHPNRPSSRLRVQTRDITAIARLLTVTGAPHAAQHFLHSATAHRSHRRAAHPDNQTPLAGGNSHAAAIASTEAIARAHRALEILGDDVPPLLSHAATLRITHPHIGLRELAELNRPPLTKDTLAGRLRRLFALADRAAAERGIPDTVAAAAAAQPGHRSLSTG